MPLVLDYEFDNFSTAADGTRKVVDASGNLNDGIMESGQWLEADGVDDYIILPSDLLPQSIAAAGEFTVRLSLVYGNLANMTFFTLSARGLQFLGYFSDLYPMRIAGSNYWTVEGIDLTVTEIPIAGKLYVIHFVVSASRGAVELYVNGVLDKSYTYLAYNPPYVLPNSSLCANYNGTSVSDYPLSNVQIWSQGFTPEQVAFDFNNPEKSVYKDVAGNIVSDNIGLDTSKLLHWFPLNEGSGNLIYDVVTNTSYTMTNFAADDTQWTNANLQPYGIQKLLYKKDVNGNPSALADPKTIRFD